MKVSVLGYGTVGRGVYDMICSCPQFTGSKVLVLPQEVSQNFHVTDIHEITEDKEIEAVVECMGGVNVAFEFVRQCIESGKSVVTSNKALVAAKGLELAECARKNGVSFLFSAACGGAIPILHNLQIARETDSIKSVRGILNGTTNYILSAMQSGNVSYKDALEDAKRLGYAEADPTADISGMDTMRKIMLISAVTFDMLPSEGYSVRGIESFDEKAAAYMQEHNLVCRLIGSCGLNEGKLYSYVNMAAVPASSPFSSVTSNFNLCVYNGQNCGSIWLGGQGAGRYPTASAVMRDLGEVLNKKHMLNSSCSLVKADNGDILRTYLVSDSKSFHKIRCSVEEIYSSDYKFFAELEEN